VAAIAGSQLGLITIHQLREVGVPDSTITHDVARGRLIPVFHGVYSVGHGYLTTHARMLAATMACGEGSVVSHGTAAWVLGLRDWKPKEIDVIAPVEAGRKIAGIRRRFVPPPVGAEVWRRHGVPLTSPARTIVDCAGILDARGVGNLIEEAAVRGLLDVVAIDRVLDGPRRRGSNRLLRAVAPWRRYRRGIKIRSRMEAKLLPLLSEAALPIPETNAKLRLAGMVYEVDFLWREQKLVVETDGGRFHHNPAAGERDSERNHALAAGCFAVSRAGDRRRSSRGDEPRGPTPSPIPAGEAGGQLDLLLRGEQGAVAGSGPDQRDRVRLEPGGVTRDEAFVAEEFFVPAGAGFVDALVAGGVEAEPGDRHVGVAGVGVDGDPAAFAFFAPALERAGGKRAFEKVAAVEGEGDGARTVVAGGGEAGMAAAPDVGLGADFVRRGDDRLDAGRGRGGRDQFAAGQHLRLCRRGADVDFGGSEAAGVAGGGGATGEDGESHHRHQGHA
jgi:very-short-patch-repair endonuclease